MLQLIDGKKIAERVKDEIALEVFGFNDKRPGLAIILVGEREDSKLYVSLKEKEAKKLGIDTHLYKFGADCLEKDIIETIDFLNNDKAVDGILIQLPLPAKFNTDKIINRLNPKKDVDGFHPHKPDYIKSPVLASVEACLDEIGAKGEGQLACFLYKAEVFGRAIEDMLKARDYKMVGKEKIKEADLIISALGQPESITEEMLKPGVILIDIGISRVGAKVKGDVKLSSAQKKASYLTPVPGGVGPMTIAFLFKNVLEIYKREHK